MLAITVYPAESFRTTCIPALPLLLNGLNLVVDCLVAVIATSGLAFLSD